MAAGDDFATLHARTLAAEEAARTARGATPTTLECLMHPIDCASAASSAVSSDLAGVAAASTAPLAEVSRTAMWTAIGIAAAVVGVVAVCIVAVYAFHRI